MFRRLFSAVKRGIKKAWEWLKGKPPIRQIRAAYHKAVVRSTPWVLKHLYKPGSLREKFFTTRVGYWTLAIGWRLATPFLMAGYPAYDGVRWAARKSAPVTRPIGRGLAWLGKAVLVTTSYVWSAVVNVFVTIFAAYVWYVSFVGFLVGRAIAWTWGRLTGDRKGERRLNQAYRYVEFKRTLAFFYAAFLRVSAGPSYLFGRLTGYEPTWYMMEKISDVVAKLSVKEYDYWFTADLPYGYPVERDERFTIQIIDGQLVEAEPISDRERNDNWFIQAGFVLVEQDSNDPNEVFEDRLAKINAAEIAKDDFGQTWAIPKEGEPLFVEPEPKLVSRHLADDELGYIDETDLNLKSRGYGRHHAAKLIDEGSAVVTNEKLRNKERSALASKIRGTELRIEHVLRGFDGYISERKKLLEKQPQATSS